MAERRMFAKTIIDSDIFLDMPLSTQALYFHLSMRADDDGFINNSKKIQRMIGCGDDDLKLLIAKKFLLPFESGVVVIKHWRIHNYIQNDRYTETNYKFEKSTLNIDENKSYTLEETGRKLIKNKIIKVKNELYTNCIHDGYAMDTQDSIGKDSIGKDKLEETIVDSCSSIEKEEDKNNKKKKKSEFDIFIEEYTENLKLKETIYEFIKMRKAIKAPMTSNALKLMLRKLDNISNNDDEKIEIINNSILNSWKGIFPLKSTDSEYRGNSRNDKGGENKGESIRTNIEASEGETEYNFNCY